MLRIILKVCLVFSLLLFVIGYHNASSAGQAAPALAATAYSGCGGGEVAASNPDFEAEVAYLVNQERAAHDLPPLKRIPELALAARYHSADLALDDYFDHSTYDRLAEDLEYICTPWDRIKNYYSGARAENIAAGYMTPEEVMSGWMNSDGHRANILSTSAWEIGVGFYSGSGYYQRYWTQDFGRRSGVFPLIINMEAATTETPQVEVYIYGSWEAVRLRNNEGEWGDWQTFTNSINWTLPYQSGEHTVNAEMRSGTDVVSASDTIYLSQMNSMLGNLPTELYFTFSLEDQQLAPNQFNLQPLNVGSADPLNWMLISEAAWLEAVPLQGTTPDTVVITPVVDVLTTPGIYTTVLTIAVQSTGGEFSSRWNIPVTVQVSQSSFLHLYLPSLLH